MADLKDNQQLPSLNACMRGGRTALAKAGVLIWTEGTVLGMKELTSLLPEEVLALYRQAGGEDSELDETYVTLMRSEAVARISPILAAFFEESLAQEAALTQMDAAGGGMGLAVADCVRLLRAGLYATNGENEAH